MASAWRPRHGWRRLALGGTLPGPHRGLPRCGPFWWRAVLPGLLLGDNV